MKPRNNCLLINSLAWRCCPASRTSAKSFQVAERVDNSNKSLSPIPNWLLPKTSRMARCENGGRATSNLGLIRVHLCSSVALCLSFLRPHKPRKLSRPKFSFPVAAAPWRSGLSFRNTAASAHPNKTKKCTNKATLLFPYAIGFFRKYRGWSGARRAASKPRQILGLSVFICVHLWPSAFPFCVPTSRASCLGPNFHFLWRPAPWRSGLSFRNTAASAHPNKPKNARTKPLYSFLMQLGSFFHSTPGHRTVINLVAGTPMPLSPFHKLAAVIFLSIPAFAQTSVKLPDGVHAVWDTAKAFRETTPTRERLSINGLWQWQPATTATPPLKPTGATCAFPNPGPPATSAPRRVSSIPTRVGRTPLYAISPPRGTSARSPFHTTGPAAASPSTPRYLNSYAAVYLDGKPVGELRYPAGEIDLIPRCNPARPTS